MEAREQQRSNPYMAQGTLYLAKVVAVHPDRGTVDVALDGAGPGGGGYQECKVSVPYGGTQTGDSYLPTVTPARPVQQKNGLWDLAIASKERDVWCLVGHISGRARKPMVIAWLQPPEGQMLFQTQGIRVQRHESGVYRVTLPNGHDELRWPDGTFLTVGPDTASHDMTQENSEWSIPLASAANVVLQHSSGAKLVITPAGDIEVYPASGQNLVLGGSGGANVARVGDPVQVNTTTGIGTITSGSANVTST